MGDRSMRRRAPAVRLWAVLAATVGCTGVATPADVRLEVGRATGATLRPLLGVNIGPLPSGEPGNADLTEAYRRHGVTTIRTHDYYGPLDVAQMYPDDSADPFDPASYDFAESDRVFAAIVGNGFEPYLRLGNSWNNSRAPRNRAHWVEAAVEVVGRYHDAARWGRPLTHVEIWNEPDNRQFWDGTPEEFFALYAETARALQAAFPGLSVGGPGLTPAGALSPQGREWTQAFLGSMRQRGVRLDFFSWHMYSNRPSDFAEAAAFYRETLDRAGYVDTETHCTEWNTSFRPPEEADPAVRTGAKASALTTASWIALQQGGVTVSTFYRGPDPAPDAVTFYGMFYADGRPKPAALAFTLWRDLAAHPLQREVVVSGGPGSLWVLAGQDGSGGVALLLANASDQPLAWEASGLGGSSLTLHEIAAPATAVSTRSLSGAGATLGAWSTQLVVTTP